MQNLFEEAKVSTIIDPASVSSATTGDYITMKNYDRVDFIINIGAVTAGGNIKIVEAQNVSGSSAATLNFDHYWKCTATTDVFTKTSANSSGSADCITVGNSSDNKCFIVSVPAAKLSASFDCLTVTLPAAFSACLTSVVAVSHKADTNSRPRRRPWRKYQPIGPGRLYEAPALHRG